MLSIREGFSIDEEKKNVKYYFKILRHLRKPKDLEDAAKHNPSFTAFVAALRPIRVD